MKQLLIPMLLLAMVACKKEDETKKDDSNNPVEVTKANLVATWNINKFEEYSLPGDSLLNTYNFPAGSATLTLRNDDTYSTVLSLGTSNGTYSLFKLGSRNFIILMEPGDRPDTTEVLSLTSSSLVTSDRYAEVNDGDDDYSKGYMTK